MDNSPLNEAHYHHRKAEASMRKRRYDDAILHHQRAAELLECAITLTKSPKAIESIKLQKEYHLKQKNIINAKKSHEEEVKRKLIEKIELAKRKGETSRQTTMDQNKDRIPVNIKAAVNRTMDDADSLLLFLVNRHNLAPELLGKEGDVACKEPKNDQMVIEELQTVNQQLRTLVSHLFQQLEEVQQENDLLKCKLKALNQDEDDGIETLTAEPSPPPANTSTEAPSLSVMTDSVCDNLSPYIFSPSTDLSPIDSFPEIKELPPLEMPNFDYEEMMSQLKASREANKSIFKKKDFRHSDLDPQ